ncbi:MAG: response regulator transcription factor [Bryobacteraceae bacterium]|nr:response regulator transcription factor [Bryobacteraceae bacterium]
MRLLLVEDDTKLSASLKKGLEEEGCSVELAADGELGLELALHSDFDVVVLDVMLPNLDGFQIVRRLRGSQNSTPVLLLTARDAVSDIVAGLDLGADDYLTKPFSFEVLLARLRTIARRRANHRPLTLRVADLELDPSSRTVLRSGREITLTKTEFNLLQYLMRRSGKVVSRDALIDAVWGLDSDIENNTLDAFIRLLRRKIGVEPDNRLIQTIRGVGYSIREETPE